MPDTLAKSCQSSVVSGQPPAKRTHRDTGTYPAPASLSPFVPISTPSCLRASPPPNEPKLLADLHKRLSVKYLQRSPPPRHTNRTPSRSPKPRLAASLPDLRRPSYDGLALDGTRLRNVGESPVSLGCSDGEFLVRFCVVQIGGQASEWLCVERQQRLYPLDAPASLRGALEQLGPDGLNALAARATGDGLPLDKVARWLPPVPAPRTFRDFYAFEQHVKTCRQKRGQEMPPEWYEIPVFYFSNPCGFRGHREPVRRPGDTRELDFELEVACVIGKEVTNVAGPEAEESVFGYTVLNDLSARDLQRREMTCMLGPAKGKDFATAIGPYVVTPDELDDVKVGPGRYNLAMMARKNGREISRGSMQTLTHDFTRMIERASRDAALYAGDIIGSGTVGTGCILELGPENTGGWLAPGDTIELEIDRLGTLTTPIV